MTWVTNEAAPVSTPAAVAGPGLPVGAPVSPAYIVGTPVKSPLEVTEVTEAGFAEGTCVIGVSKS